MSFGRVASLVIAIVAVLALFVEIPIVSDYAFWFLVGALIIWMGVHSQNTKNRFRWQTMLSIALLLVAIVGGSVRRDPDSERIRLLGSVRRLSRLSWQYQLFFELRSISGLLPSPSPSARAHPMR
jgi:carbon starvation protein CstA